MCFRVFLNRQTLKRISFLMNHLFGQHYYNLFLHFFYKIVLLKLSYEYSQLTFHKNSEGIERLIRSITVFSGKYLFLEISSRTEGQEFSELFKKSSTSILFIKKSKKPLVLCIKIKRKSRPSVTITYY